MAIYSEQTLAGLAAASESSASYPCFNFASAVLYIQSKVSQRIAREHASGLCIMTYMHHEINMNFLRILLIYCAGYVPHTDMVTYETLDAKKSANLVCFPISVSWH